MQNDVWENVPRPKDKSILGSRWVYKVKHGAYRSVKYEARFVAKGFSQIAGIDYEETFATIAQYSSIKTILALATLMGWKIH